MKRAKKFSILTAALLLLAPLTAVNTAQATTSSTEFPLESSPRTTNVQNTTSSKTNQVSTKTQALSNASIADITRNEHFANNTISYYITPGTAVGVQQDIRAGALNWNMKTNVNFYETKNKNNAAIVFTNDGTDSTENGLTTNRINNSKGYTEVISSKIDLSKATIQQNQLTTMGRRVVEHELGHALGLKDSKTDDKNTIMWYKTPNTDITDKDAKAIALYY